MQGRTDICEAQQGSQPLLVLVQASIADLVIAENPLTNGPISQTFKGHFIKERPNAQR